MPDNLPKPRRTALIWRQHVDRFFGRARKHQQQRSPADAPINNADILDWGLTFLPDHFRLPPSQMHRWLAEQLDAMPTVRGAKLNVVGPRGSAKSTVTTLAFVLREALIAREPYIWIISDTKHQAAAHLENVKTELLENRLLNSAYSQAAGMGAVWRAGAILLRNGALIEAFGTGQRIRGRRRRQHRPTLIVCDDLQNDSHIQSALARDHSRAWFHGMLMKAGTKTTNVVNLGTALHRECLAMELHRTPGWISQVFRAIQHWPDQMPLWHHWDQLYYDMDQPQARSQAHAFYQEHRSAMDAGAVLLWPESYFGDWIWFDTWPPNLRLRTLALDPSKGVDARHGDFSAFVMLGIAHDGLLYIEADLARRPSPQMVTDGIDLCRRFQPHAFGLESNQFQELLGPDFSAELIRHGMISIAPCSIENRTNKVVRIRRLGPLLASRRLRFKTRSPGTSMLVEQLREFPISSHDDGPDAAEMALRLAEAYLQPVPAGDGLGHRLI
jgi:predicted phage terminase large subunit-like protein